MTLKEFREQTNDLPEDTVICMRNAVGWDGDLYELSSVESFKGLSYYNEQDEIITDPEKTILLL